MSVKPRLGINGNVTNDGAECFFRSDRKPITDSMREGRIFIEQITVSNFMVFFFPFPQYPRNIRSNKNLGRYKILTIHVILFVYQSTELVIVVEIVVMFLNTIPCSVCARLNTSMGEL